MPQVPLIAALIAAPDPAWHWGETQFPSFFSHHKFSVVHFLVERALCCSDEGEKKNKKEDKGEREQRYMTKFSARIFTLG